MADCVQLLEIDPCFVQLCTGDSAAGTVFQSQDHGFCQRHGESGHGTVPVGMGIRHDADPSPLHQGVAADPGQVCAGDIIDAGCKAAGMVVSALQYKHL